MNLERLKKDLIRDEGVKYHIYLDHLGYRTFGIGHLVKDYDLEYLMPLGYMVSQERVNEVFEKDVEIAIQSAKSIYLPEWKSFPSEVQEILVNMVFNLGRNGLSKFVNMNKELKNQNWKKAAIEGRDSLWYKQVTNRAERLMKRLEELNA